MACRRNEPEKVVCYFHGLPDDLVAGVLARVSFWSQASVRGSCRRFRGVLASPSFLSTRRRLGCVESTVWTCAGGSARSWWLKDDGLKKVEWVPCASALDAFRGMPSFAMHRAKRLSPSKLAVVGQFADPASARNDDGDDDEADEQEEPRRRRSMRRRACLKIVVYDFGLNKWSLLPDLPRRHQSMYGALGGLAGRPVVFRSDGDVAVFEDSKWATLPSAGFVNPGVVTADSRKFFVVVDWTFVRVDVDDSPQETASLQVRTFDKTQGAWTQRRLTEVQVEVKSRGVLLDGLVYVCGKKPSSVVAYDPNTDAIRRIKPPKLDDGSDLPLAPCHLSVFDGALALFPRDAGAHTDSETTFFYVYAVASRHKNQSWQKRAMPPFPADPDRDTIIQMVESAVGYNPYGGFVPVELG